MNKFIAVYTNQCKEYCDKEFFDNLQDIKDHVYVMDNTTGLDYHHKLKTMIPNVYHSDIQSEAKIKFLNNVTLSANFLRELFLASNYEYFITLESDVIPPKGWLEMFDEVIDKADIIGGVYYLGFHSEKDFTEDSFYYTGHVLSGCALYKRPVIEAIPFRWSDNDLNAFPDAWMSYDAKKKGFKLANYTKIRCNHLSKPDGSRGLEDIK